MNWPKLYVWLFKKFDLCIRCFLHATFLLFWTFISELLHSMIATSDVSLYTKIALNIYVAMFDAFVLITVAIHFIRKINSKIHRNEEHEIQEY